jgi:hypothetical protein
MLLRSRLLRPLTALIATVALLTAAARPVLACDMVMAEADRDATSALSVESVDPHAHHGVVPDGPARADADAPSAPDPSVPACDHVVGCTVMVLASRPTIALAPITPMDAAPRTTAADVDAPIPAVEPPPPRR